MAQVTEFKREEIAEWAEGYASMERQYLDPFKTAADCCLTARNALASLYGAYLYEGNAQIVADAMRDFDRIKEQMKDIIVKRGYLLTEDK